MRKNGPGRFVALGLGSGLIGGVLIALTYVGGPATAQESKNLDQQVVSGKEFRLVDEQGKARAILALSAEGEPSMTMVDRNGIAIVSLGISDDSGLAIRDVDGKTRLVLSLSSAGQPSLVFRDRQHRTRSFQPE